MSYMNKLPGIYDLHQILYHNPPVEEVPEISYPQVSEQAVVGKGSMIIGDVTVEEDVFIGFNNIIRADSSAPFHIGTRTNIQDFVAIHCHPGHNLTVDGKKRGLHLESDVSILHHAVVHGPVYAGHNTYIGANTSIFGAIIGRNCVIMHGATILNHVTIADNRWVAPGQVVSTQAQAEALPEVPAAQKRLNAELVDHYFRLGKSYQLHTPLAF
jgi:carbonic anhydrase